MEHVDEAMDDTAPDRPAFISEQDDGALTIKLSRPLVVDGVSMPSLTMREPTVGDQMSAMKAKSSASREIAIFANLCEIAPDDIARLPLRDYGRLQAAFADFLS